jgi:hypothetical protein
MEARYNVYFAGAVMAGNDPLEVRGKLGKIFNADEPTLDKLFSGAAQLIKRDCDKTMALKYKAALERAGAIAIIKASSSAADTDATASDPRPRKLTAAERIAALAAAPDEDRYRQETSGATPAPAAVASASAATADPQTGEIALAPPGTDVLREEERAEAVTRNIDTSALVLDSAGQRLSEEAPAPPSAPDTQHLSMGDVGDTIPTLPSSAVPLNPDLNGLSLSAAGTDFSDCTPAAAAAPELDLSALEALPAGAVPEQEQQGRRQTTSAPVTDHISLQD